MKTLLLLSIVIGLDILFNWWLIVKKNKKPNHPLNWLVRAVLGSIIGYNTDTALWLRNATSYIPVYWFTFDYGLNWARHKPLAYLGDSWLDGIQKSTMGEVPWFFFKAMLCLFSLLLIIFNYSPNPW